MNDVSERYGYQVGWSEEDQLFVAYCAELPGIAAHGVTAEVALREIREAAKGSVELLTESGKPVPQPLAGFSGKLSLRLSPELHRHVTLQAIGQGVSLNRYICAKLGR